MFNLLIFPIGSPKLISPRYALKADSKGVYKMDANRGNNKSRTNFNFPDSAGKASDNQLNKDEEIKENASRWEDHDPENKLEVPGESTAKKVEREEERERVKLPQVHIRRGSKNFAGASQKEVELKKDKTESQKSGEKKSLASMSNMSRQNSRLSRSSELDPENSMVFKRHDSGNSENEFAGFDEKKKLKNGNKLRCPEGTLNKILFVIFFPIYFVLWLFMPDVKREPNFSKVLLSSILIFMFSLILGYFYYTFQSDLVLAWEVKPEVVGVFNGFLLNMG